MKNNIIIATILIINNILTYSQNSEFTNFDVKPQTPTSYQFSRYDNMPVSEYTGIPSISIPLYTINEDGVDIPLNLNYHAGGIRVDQEASWVGLGWDLSSGAIVQSINGEDDLFPYHKNATYRFRPDYFRSDYYNAILLPYDYHKDKPGNEFESSTYPIQSVEKNKFGYRVATNFYLPKNGKYTRYEAMMNRSTTYIDSEPDIFTANFLGEKLHFIMKFEDNMDIKNYKKPTEAYILNKKNYRIKISYDSDTTARWIVTNPYGVQFHFNEQIGAMSSSISPGRPPSYGGTDYSSARNTWLLTKIVTRNNKEIIFKYNTTKAVSRLKSISHLGEKRIMPNTDSDRNSGGSGITYETWAVDQGPQDLMISTSTIKEPYTFLEKITFPEGYINITLSSRSDEINSKKLSKLEVYNSLGKAVKFINFQYEYFKEFADQGSRLKLLSVSMNNEKYTFKYNSETLPPRTSFAQDYWGYYNGAFQNVSLLPNPTELVKSIRYDHINTGNKKSSNLQYTKAGILEEITYPTGGSTSFEYESNEFEQYNGYWVANNSSKSNTISKGYGLRIKNVIYKDNGAEIKRTSYEYKKGKAINPQNFARDINYEWYASNFSTTRVSSEYITILSTAGLYNNSPFSTLASVGYDTVICIQKGGNLDSNGKIVSVYNNNYDIVNTTEPPGGQAYFLTFLPSIKNPSFPENGSLKSRIYYNGANKKIKEEKYDYELSFSELHYGVKISGFSPVTRLSVYSGVGNRSALYSRHLLAYYPIYDFETLLKKEESIDYMGGNTVKTTTDFAYDNSNRLINKSTLVSTGSIMKEEYKYYPTNGNLASTIFPLNRYADIIEINKYINNNQISYLHIDYKKFNTGRLLATKVDQGKDPNNVQCVIYNDYDYQGNLLEKTDASGLVTSYVWETNQQHPIAKIENATYTEAMSAIQAGNAGKVTVERINAARTKLPNAHITTYEYQPLVGITKITDPRGVVTTYEYDSFGRLKATYITEGSVKRIIQEYQYNYRNK